MTTIVEPVPGVGIEVGASLDGEGDVVLEVGAVGHVVVDEEVGQPAMKHGHEGAGLRRIGLHVVAVQIEVGPVAAPAHLFGAVLVDAVVGRAPLMPIGVVHGDEDEDGAIEQAASLPVMTMSRSSARQLSLPSISPAWMAFCTSTMGRFAAWSAAGSKTPSFDAMTMSSSRPSPVLPKGSMRTCCGFALPQCGRR